MSELQLQHSKLQLHELIECYDWEGVIELLQKGDDDEEEATRRAHTHTLASQENCEGHLALHSSELYQPGALMEAIEAIVEAYPEALTTPTSSSDPSTGMGSGAGMYPLHIVLDTMLESQASPGDESQDTGYEAYYFEIVKMLLQRAPQVAQYATPSGMLPLHYAAQLHIDGLVELVIKAYPQGASKQLTQQHTNALPLHLACRSSSKSHYFALPILQLLFAYPAGAQVQDWALEDIVIGMEDDFTVPIARRFPLHHVCANRDLLRMMEGSHDPTLVQLLHQAHPEAALKLDHRGRSPLSLLCQHSNSMTNMEALVYLLQQTSSHQCAAMEDSQGRLPLHYLADNLASSESSSVSASINQVWKMLVCAHPQALFHKDCQDQHTPVSLLLLSTKENNENGTMALTQSLLLLQTSFVCCGGAPPATSTPMALSHLLAFFAMALHPTSGQRMALLQQAMRASSFGYIRHVNMNLNVDSQGNNMLHMACLGLHWASSNHRGSEVEQLHDANTNDSMSTTNGQHDSPEEGMGNLMIILRKNAVAVAVNSAVRESEYSSSSHCSSPQGGCAQVIDLIMSSTGGCSRNLVEMPNHEGQLPLHLLLTNTTSTSSVLTQHAAQRLVRAYPDSASLQDPTTGLVPFMSAASAASNTIIGTSTSTFELLRDFVAVSDFSSMAFSVLTANCGGGVNDAGSRSNSVRPTPTATLA
jgi:hypothetical protein